MVKPTDSWWTVLVIDPVATRVVPVLSRVPWLTPTVVTLIALATGLGAVAAFAAGTLWLGAVLFQVRFFFDCLDGKIARFRGLSSRWGAFIDLVADIVCGGGAYLALALAVAPQQGPWRILLPLAITVYFVCTCVHIYSENIVGAREPREGRRGRSHEWLTRHRLKPYPTSVEVEACALFLAPLLLPVGLVRGVLLVAQGFYLLRMLTDCRRVWLAVGKPAADTATSADSATALGHSRQPARVAMSPGSLATNSAGESGRT